MEDNKSKIYQDRNSRVIGAVKSAILIDKTNNKINVLLKYNRFLLIIYKYNPFLRQSIK